MDTKNNIGGYSTPMPADSYRTVKVAGLAGIPNDGSAGAVSVVATVADISAQGTLFGRPDADTSQTLMGIYGGDDKQTTSFSAVLAVGSGGTIQIKTNTTARLILDVQGYYTSNDDGTAPGGFVAMNGKRIVDTRSGLGAPQAALASTQSVDVQVTGTAGVPAGASAVIVNLIAIPTIDKGGWLTPYATGTTRPANSLNYAAGTSTSMQAQVPLSASGKMTVWNGSSTTNLVVDVQGYFTAAGKSGAVFTPGAGRAYDSRATGNTALAKNETRSIQIAGKAGVPVMGSGITAVVLTLTSLATNGTGNATVWADGTTRPNTTSINFTDGTIRTNTITVPLGVNGKVSLNNVADVTNYVIDVQGWYTNPQSITVTCAGGITAQSWTESVPAQPIDCAVTVPAAAMSDLTGQTIVDGAVVNEFVPSESGSLTQTVTVPNTPGNHEIDATYGSADGEFDELTVFAFAFGEWSQTELAPVPSVDSVGSLDPQIDITPDYGTSLPPDMTTQVVVSTNPDGVTDPVFVSDWSADGHVPDSALEDGQTYYWTANAKGSGHFDGTEQAFTTPVYSFTASAEVTDTDDSAPTTVTRAKTPNWVIAPAPGHTGGVAMASKTLVQQTYSPRSVNSRIAGCTARTNNSYCGINQTYTVNYSINVAYNVSKSAVSVAGGWSKTTSTTTSVECSKTLKKGEQYYAYPEGPRYKYKLQKYDSHLYMTSQSGWLYSFIPRKNQYQCG